MITKVEIGDICNISSAGDKPAVFSHIETESCRIPVIANGIDNEGIIGYTDGAKVVSEAVTVSARGNVGTAFYRSAPYYPVIRLLTVIPKNYSSLDCKYLYYLLRNSPLKGIGSVQAQLTVPDVSKMEVFYDSDIIKQKYISDILWSIDTKIEKNNAICADLEAMAKQLYDYWFVQFDFPDENGKPYKSSGGKMVWNEELKREIPEGWEVGNLYDIASFINGLACQNYRPVDDNRKLPVIKIGEMHNGIGADVEWARDDVPQKNIIDNGDILFSWSASLEVMLWNKGKGVLNQHIFKVVPQKYDKYYVYQQLAGYIINFVKMAEARKTTMGHITTDHLKQSRIPLPPIELSKMYGKYVEDIYSEFLNCSVENDQLASLRDFLLPMLMNGQVKVGEKK